MCGAAGNFLAQLLSVTDWSHVRVIHGSMLQLNLCAKSVCVRELCSYSYISLSMFFFVGMRLHYGWSCLTTNLRTMEGVTQFWQFGVIQYISYLHWNQFLQKEMVLKMLTLTKITIAYCKLQLKWLHLIYTLVIGLEMFGSFMILTFIQQMLLAEYLIWVTVWFTRICT